MPGPQRQSGPDKIRRIFTEITGSTQNSAKLNQVYTIAMVISTHEACVIALPGGPAQL
jgi:hypothetical protein